MPRRRVLHLLQNRFYVAVNMDGTGFEVPHHNWTVGQTVVDQDLAATTAPDSALQLAGFWGRGKWPCRLMIVEGSPVDPIAHHLHDRYHQKPFLRYFNRLQVIEEIDSLAILGPQGQEIIGMLERMQRLTREEMVRLAGESIMQGPRQSSRARRKAVETGRDAAWDVVRHLTYTNLRAPMEIVEACWYALIATLMRDLITPREFQRLCGPWNVAIARQGVENIL